MFKSRNTDPSINVKMREEAGLMDFLKIILMTILVGMGITYFVSSQDLSNMNGDGVVFKNLSKTYANMESSFDSVLLNKESKEENKTMPEGEKEVANENAHNVFFIEYNGSMMATEVKYLKEKIDAVILKANEDDEVLIKVTSPGGAVSGYGLVSSQINRLKLHGLKVTAAVDTVAASGGYMAAVVADEIVAAPFAMVGSIGVVANVMIYEDLLTNLGLESKVYTAGESKRTVVPMRKPTPEEEAKLEEQLESIHNRFKDHVLGYRPDIAVDKVFTGEAFLAVDAIKYGLVDKIGTSDEILLTMYKDGHRLIKVEYQINEDFSSSMTKEVSAALFESIRNEIANNGVIFH